MNNNKSAIVSTTNMVVKVGTRELLVLFDTSANLNYISSKTAKQDTKLTVLHLLVSKQRMGSFPFTKAVALIF